MVGQTKTITELKEQSSKLEKEIIDREIVLKNLQEMPTLKSYLEIRKILEEGEVLFEVMQTSMKAINEIKTEHVNLMHHIKQHQADPEQKEVQTTTQEDRPEANQDDVAYNEFRVRKDKAKYEGLNVSDRHDENEIKRKTEEICDDNPKDVGQDDVDLSGLPDFEDQ